MASMTEMPADTVLVTLRSGWDRAFLALAIEGQVARARRDGTPDRVTAEWSAVAERLRRQLDADRDLPEVPLSVPTVDGLGTDVRGWVSTETVAAHLRAAGARCSPRYVRRLLAEGRIRGRLVGRKWFADPESVAEFMTERNAA